MRMRQDRLRLSDRRRLQYYMNGHKNSRGLAAADRKKEETIRQDNAAKSERLREAINFIAARVRGCGIKYNPGLNIQKYDLANVYRRFAITRPDEISYPSFEATLLAAVTAMPPRVIFHVSATAPILYLPDALPQSLSNKHKPTVEDQVTSLHAFFTSMEDAKATTK
jgi:hypothetical protein